MLLGRMPLGSVIKTITVYARAFWRPRYSGQLVCDAGPLSVTYDDCTTEHAALMGFIQGKDAYEWAQRTVAERQQAVCAQYARMFENPEALECEQFIEKNWSLERYSDGCYVGLCPPGVLTSFGHALREPFNLVHWAGTETSEIFQGYMEGAVRAGERAAAEVSHSLTNETL